MTLTETLIAESQKYIFNTYFRSPLVIVRGEGCRVWDIEGREYLDFLGGRGTANLGHCHPRVVKAIVRQAKNLIHITNDFYIEPQIQLSRLLVKNSFADKVFFSNSGAEANEAAIKLARKYGKDTFGPEKVEIITMENSFHGRTMATLSAFSITP